MSKRTIKPAPEDPEYERIREKLDEERPDLPPLSKKHAKRKTPKRRAGFGLVLTGRDRGKIVRTR